MFGVTANHVLEAWRNDWKSKKVVALQLAGMPFDPDGRHAIIDAHEGIDIATFRITADEVRSIGKTTLTGTQRAWPPNRMERWTLHAGIAFSHRAGGVEIDGVRIHERQAVPGYCR